MEFLLRKVEKYDSIREEDIKKFQATLKALRYDASLLDDFLLTQDLSLPVALVLKVESFDQFCTMYDRAKEASTQYTKK